MLLLLALHGVVEHHAGAKNVNLAFREPHLARQKRRRGVVERVGQEQAKHHARGNGKRTHEGEQPEPSWLPADTAHVQDAVREELGARLSDLVAKVKEHDALGRLGARVPRREGPETAGDESRLCETQEEACGDKGRVATLERLERGHDAKEEQLQGEPLSRSDAIEDHVGRAWAC